MVDLPTCLVTGASGGIGLATAEALARLGQRVVLVCREATRGVHAAERVRRASAGPGHAAVDLLVADLSSQASVRRLATEVAQRCPRLDVLINNAGVITPTRHLTEDGIETQLAVNHLAPFLLTQLLRRPLEAAGAARVVVVASQVERHGTIRFDDLQGERDYDPLEAYYQSKLANVLFTYALAERWARTPITVNCLHPGVVDTRLLQAFERAEGAKSVVPGDTGGSAAIGLLAAGLQLGLRGARAGVRRLIPSSPRGGPRAAHAGGPLTPDEGARTSLYVATAPALAGVTGRYFREMAEARSSPQSYDAAARERLWSVSAGLVGMGG